MGTKLPTIQQLQSLNTQTGNQTTSNNTSESSSSIYSPSTTDAETKQENKNSNLEIIGRGLATGLGSILTGATKHIDNAIDAPSAIKNAFYSNLASKDSNKNNEIIQTKARSAADTYKQKTETSIFGQAVKNYENKIDENQQAIVADNPNSKLAETVYKGTELAESAGGVLVDAALAAATAGIGGAITGTAGMGSAAAAKAVGATAETIAAKTAAEAAVSTAAKAASLGTMWMSVFNQSNQEALNSGYDTSKSAQKAFGDATLEIATELMFAGIAGTNKKAVDGYVSKTLNKAVGDLTESEITGTIKAAVGLKKAGLAIAQGAVKFAEYADNKSWLGEALEEMTSEALGPFIERWTTGNKDVEPATLSSILEAGLGGAVLSVAMGGVGRIANKAVTDIQKQSVVKQYTSTKEGRLNLVSQIIQNGELGGEAQTKAFNQLMGRDLTTPIQKQAKGVLSKLFPGKTQSNNYIKGINLNNDGTRLMTFEALDRYVNSEQTEADFQSLIGTLEEAFAADAEYSVLKRQKEIFNEIDKTKFVESNETVKADTKAVNDAKALVDSLEEELKAETDEKAKAQISAELKTARANLSTAEEALAKSKANVAKTVGIAYSKADAVETFGQESVDRFKASQRFAIEDRGYLYTVDESGVFKPVRYNDYVEDNTDAVAQTLYKKSYDQLTKEEKSAVNDQVTKNFNTELKALKNKHSTELKQFVGELNDQISKSPIGGNLKVETKSLKGKGRMAESQGDIIRFDPSKVYTVTAAKYYLSHELLHYTVANVLGNEAKTNFYDNLKSLATSMGWSYDGFYRKMMNSRNYNATWDEQIADKEKSSGKKFSEEETIAYKEKMAEEETLARFISTALDYKQILSAMQVESPDVLAQLEQGLLKTGVKNMINTQWDYARLKALKNIEEAKATPMAAEDVKADVAKAMQSLEEDIDDENYFLNKGTALTSEDIYPSIEEICGVLSSGDYQTALDSFDDYVDSLVVTNGELENFVGDIVEELSSGYYGDVLVPIYNGIVEQLGATTYAKAKDISLEHRILLDRLVQRQASTWDYDVKLLHGSDSLGFTQIDVTKSYDERSFFATDDPKTAFSYTEENQYNGEDKYGNRKLNVRDIASLPKFNKPDPTDFYYEKRLSPQNGSLQQSISKAIKLFSSETKIRPKDLVLGVIDTTYDRFSDECKTLIIDPLISEIRNVDVGENEIARSYVSIVEKNLFSDPNRYTPNIAWGIVQFNGASAYTTSLGVFGDYLSKYAKGMLAVSNNMLTKAQLRRLYDWENSIPKGYTFSGMQFQQAERYKDRANEVIAYGYDIYDAIPNKDEAKKYLEYYDQIKDLAKIADYIYYPDAASLEAKNYKRFKAISNKLSIEKQKYCSSWCDLEALKNYPYIYEMGNSSGAYCLYASLTDVADIDAKNSVWHEIIPDESERFVELVNKAYEGNAGTNDYNRKYSTRDVAELAEHAGYKGVVIRNLYDYGEYVDKPKPSDIYIFLDPTRQLKSADPITFDDNGNYIPLEKRFDPDYNDIRYMQSLQDDDYNGAVAIVGYTDTLNAVADDNYFLTNGVTPEELELSKQPAIASIVDYLYQKGVITPDDLDAIAMERLGKHITLSRAKADIENGPYNYMMGGDKEKLTKVLKQMYAEEIKGYAADKKAIVEAKKKVDQLKKKLVSDKNAALDARARELSKELAKSRKPADAAEWYEQRALASQSLTSTKSLRDRKSPGKYMQSLDEEDFTTQERFNEYQDLKSKYGTQDTGLLKRLSPANIVGRFASSVMSLANNNGRVILTNEKTGDTQEFQNSAEASAFLNGIKSSETRADYKATDLNSAFAKNNTLEGYKVSFPDGMLVKDLRQAVIDGMLRGNYSHFILTDEKALEAARNRIRNHNIVEQAVTDFQQLANHGKGNLSKTDIVFGEQLLIDIADKMRKYEEGTLAPNESSDPEGLYDNFQKVTADLCAAASRAGQNLQAFSMLKKLTPEGRLYYVQSQVNALITDMVDRKGFSRIGGYRYMTDAQGKYYYKLDKNGNYELVRDGNVTPIQISQELTERMLSCTTQAEMEAVEEAIIQEIAAKIPTTITDRVIAWRYLAMLGNPRTHIRNIVSNLAMGKAVDVKNVIKGALEDRVLGDKTEGRTATLHRDSEQRTALLDFADTDWERDANDELTLNGGKQGYQSRLNDARNKLGFKNFDIIDRIAKLNNQLLDKEDWNAAKRAYKKAFANYCEANALTVDYFNNTDTPNSNTRLAQARAYAINEAAKATYHDANEVATLLNKLEKSSPVASLIVGGLVPFKKTPANILKRGIEYSPIGIAKGIADWVKANNTVFEESTWALNNEDALSQTGSRADGNFGNSTKLANTAFERYSADAKRTYMVAQALDELASGLTGTMVMLIGALLAHWGLLKAGGDEDDSLEYYDQMIGNQEYSITLGGKNYTLDWLTPISMPLFTGAVISDMAEGEGLEWNEVLDAIGKLADPVMNLSVLQGIDNAINSYDSGLGQAVLSAAEGYVGQFIPTALGQVARTIDPTRRTTYVAKEGESALGKDLGTFVNKLENKIPGLSFTNAAYVDQWGRQEVDQDPFILRLLKNSVFPWYEKDINKTSADDYISQLYQATGDTGVIPDTASTRFTFNNQNYYLMSGEYQATKELVGQLSNSGVNSLITTAGFSNLTADEQADLVSDVYSFARAVAKSDYAAAKGIKYTESNTTTRLKDAINSGLSVGQAVYINYMTSQMTADKDANGKSISGSKKAKVLAFYQSLGLTNEQIKAISQYDYD